MGSVVAGQDLVAVQVGDRHLGGGDQVQVVALDDVHLPLLVGQLPGAAGRGGIDEDRRPDLAVAMPLGELEHEADEGALQPRAGSGVQDEARSGDLRAALEVEQPEPLPDLPVRRRAAGRGRLAPRADDRVVVGARAVRDAVVRQVRDLAAGPPRSPASSSPSSAVMASIRSESARHPRLQLVCLGRAGRCASAHRARGCRRFARREGRSPRPRAHGAGRPRPASRSTASVASPLRAIARFTASGSSRMSWIEIMR